MSERINWYEETARRVHGKPPEWRAYLFDRGNAPPGFVKIEGSIPVGVYRSGKRKGRPKWPPRSQGEAVWLSDAELDETMRLWELHSGKCFMCQGDRQTPCGASIQPDGSVEREYRPCRRCGATGIAKQVPLCTET